MDGYESLEGSYTPNIMHIYLSIYLPVPPRDWLSWSGSSGSKTKYSLLVGELKALKTFLLVTGDLCQTKVRFLKFSALLGYVNLIDFSALLGYVNLIDFYSFLKRVCIIRKYTSGLSAWFTQ